MFGKYHQPRGETILVCEPQRSSCLPYIVIPDGVIAIIMKSGAFEQYGEPGIYPCLPWTEAKYLVSKQDFVYESPDNRVLTRDNLAIFVSISILIKIEAEHENVL